MKYPKYIMENVEWVFSDGPNKTINDFIEKVCIHCENINVKCWDTREIAIYIPKIHIKYSYWNESIENDVYEDFLLIADNKSYFTNGELLFKIHNAIEYNLAENLEEHIFFGGLVFCEEEKDNIPIYELALKS